MYKLFKDNIINWKCIIKLSDNANIPFEPANTDYQQFKTDIANGVELQDADGNVMTGDALTTFIGNLK
jgi:hypothetical protein